MRYLLLPFFFIRLNASLALSCLRLGYYQLPPLASLCLAGLFLVWAIMFNPVIPKPTAVATYLSPTASTTTQALPPALSPEVLRTYQTNLEIWLRIAQLQPTHRDVLLNIAHLYQALGNSDQYQSYRLQAQQIDPNHPAFQNK